VFRKNVYVECKPNKKSDIYRQILENDYIRRNFDRDDGLVNFSDSGCIRIIPDEVRPRIRITVESFDEEYAEDMADRFTKIVSEYADE
ncbi:MAG: hypothetical protein IJZ90_03375, partial [Clostridia bacterium]|nr:hypothetical protein [Clostridia bacterium]